MLSRLSLNLRGNLSLPPPRLPTRAMSSLLSPDNVFSSRFPAPTPTSLLLCDYITKDWHTTPDKKAIIEGISNEELTYAEYSDVTSKLTSYLEPTIACTPETRTTATIFSPNHIHFLPALLSILRLGGVVSPANPLYTWHELRNQIVKSRSTVVVAHVAGLEVVREAIKGLNITKIIVLTSPDITTPPLTNFDSPSVVTLDDSVTSVNTLITEVPSYVKSLVGVNDLALLPYSSGTTGLPKGTMLSHHNVSINCSQFMPPENDFLSPHSTVMSPLPFFHIYGLVAGALAQARLQNTLVTMRSFDFMRFLELCDEYKPERAHLVPPIVLGLTKHPAVDDFDLSSMKMILSAAAPLGGDVAKALHERIGVQCKQAWGMSELSPAGTVTPDDDLVDYQTIGPVVGGSFSKIVCLETGVNLPPGEENTGELCIKGPQVMLGYLDEPDKTRECLSEDGWLQTGDIGYARGTSGMLDEASRAQSVVSCALERAKRVLEEENERPAKRRAKRVECWAKRFEHKASRAEL